MRPVLLLLCGNLEAVVKILLVRAAAAVELIHAASLIHDDVIDASPKRRKTLVEHDLRQPFGSVSGRFLFCPGFELIACCGDFALNMLLPGRLEPCAKVRIEQARLAFDPFISEEEYLTIFTARRLSCLKPAAGLEDAWPDWRITN